MTDDEHYARLRWRCRRGMLEVDQLLGPYVEQCYLKLSADQQADFERLLDIDDQTLFSWLIKAKISDDPGLAAVVQSIRDHHEPNVVT